MTTSEAFYHSFWCSVSGTVFILMGVVLSLIFISMGWAWVWQIIESKPRSDRDEAPTASAGGSLPLPARRDASPLTPVTTLRNSMVARGVSAMTMAEEINRLIKPTFLVGGTSGSHVQVAFTFSPTGFTEISWQAHGDRDYMPRVKCYRDGVLIFSESGRGGVFTDHLEAGIRYRFRFEICSDLYPNAKPTDDVERFILVPTKAMMLATVEDENSHSTDRLYETVDKQSTRSKPLREHVDGLREDD